MAFKYRKRTSDDVKKRAEATNGDFQGFIKDEFKVFRPKKGDNWVRILPPTWEDTETYGDHYGIEIFTHYGIGPDRASVLCTAKMPNPDTGRTSKCPICAARGKLDAAGDEAEAKELRTTKRVLVWMLDKKDPDKGPQVWPMPATLDTAIAKVSIDKRDGKTYFIDHPESGYDVTFEVEGEKMTTKYVGVQLARKRSAVDEEHLEFIAEHPLPETLLYRTAKEVQAIYEGGGADDDEDEAPKKKAKRRAEPDDDDDDDDDAPVAKKAKRRAPVEDDDDDEEDFHRGPKKKAKAKPVDDDDDDDDEPAPPKKKARPKLVDPDDDDDDDEPAPKVKAKKKRPEPEDDDDDEDDAPPPKKKSKAKPVDDDEEDEDDDDRIPSKGGKAGKPSAKKSAPADDDDDDDDDADDDDEDEGAAAAERAKRLKKRFTPR